MTTAEAFWFGKKDRALFGWLHLPAGGTVRGGVVLCLPFGLEATCTYYAYRRLAEALALVGYAVLRFDYDGTGDSVGDHLDPDRVQAWRESTRVAAELLTDLGVGSIAFVGCRMGALFAAEEVARRGGADALVLWDPCLSGAAYLREQQALAKLRRRGTGRTEDGADDVLGAPYDGATIQDLRELELRAIQLSDDQRVLVLTREHRRVSNALKEYFQGIDVDWDVAVGQEELLDSELQATPIETIETITTWLQSVVSGDEAQVVAPVERIAAIGEGVDGAPLIETIERIGPAGLFGIVTGPLHGSGAPALVLVNDARTHHTGQSRLWVELGRRWARLGFQVVRFDLSGHGDSPVRPGQTPRVVLSPEASDDLRDVRAAVSPDDPANVVVIGLCSGAYEAVETALAAPARCICAINPRFAFESPEKDTASATVRRARQLTKPWLSSIATGIVEKIAMLRSASPERWVRAFATGEWPSELAKVYPHVPEAVWQIVNRLFIERPVAELLDMLAAKGVDVIVICGGEDLDALVLGSRARIARMRERRTLELISLPELDHAGLLADQRALLGDALTESLLRRFGPALRRPPVASR